MSIAQDAAFAIAEGRAMAESLMTSTGIARRATGGTTTDENDSDVPELADLFQSKAKIQSTAVQAREAEVGGRTSVTISDQLHLPVAAPAMTTGDLWYVLSSEHDPLLVGRTYRVVAPVAKEYATARRYEVEEVVA